MSELTPCNHCTWKRRKELAKKRGEEVRLAPSKEMKGWTAVLLKDKNGKEKEVTWFMELTDHCVC